MQSLDYKEENNLSFLNAHKVLGGNRIVRGHNMLLIAFNIYEMLAPEQAGRNM